MTFWIHHRELSKCFAHLGHYKSIGAHLIILTGDSWTWTGSRVARGGSGEDA
jgi:hypothetical protein